MILLFVVYTYHMKLKGVKSDVNPRIYISCDNGRRRFLFL